MWTQGPINRSFQRDPRRVLIWFVVVPIVGIAAATALIAAGSPRGYLLAIATAVLVAQAIVYAPRAYRAVRDGRDG